MKTIETSEHIFLEDDSLINYQQDKYKNTKYCITVIRIVE